MTYREYYLETQRRFVQSPGPNKAGHFIEVLADKRPDLYRKVQEHDRTLADQGVSPRSGRYINPGTRYNKRVPKMLTFVRENW